MDRSKAQKDYPFSAHFKKNASKWDELHGIEVVNFGAFAEESLALALEQT
jgi:hypothetical protein